jgi:Protein of unknown function (DUF4231)
MASETPSHAASARVSPAQRTAAEQEADRNAIADAERREKWYRTYASVAEWTYRILVIFQLAFAAAVPVSAAAHAPVWVAAVFGAIAAVLTGTQQVLGVGQDYVRLSATHVSIDRELRLYRALAGPYANAEAPAQLLTIRVEDAVALDTTRWVTQSRKAEEEPAGAVTSKSSSYGVDSG